MREIARELHQQAKGKGVEAPVLTLRQAVIQSVQASTVTIRIGGSTTDIAGVRYPTHYTPSAGHVVEVLGLGPDLRILHRLT